MAVNRYTSPSVAMYNPMGLEELAFAPSFLRQRHDETNAAIQALNEQVGQYNVHGNFQDIAGQLIDPITQELTGLSSDLSQKGINESRGVDRLMQLNAKQKELFSPRGAIGQLQSRTQQYQEQIKGISDFFKDNPELARFKLSQSNIGQASINPETGKLELGDMQIPNYVRHIADEDIMKQLNDAVKGLKPSDLGAAGIQFRGKLGELNQFTDLYNEDMFSGVTPERIQALLGSLIGPEIQQSVAQYGEMMGYSPEESLGMLNNRLMGIAASSAYTDRSRRYFQITDDLELYKAKKSLENLELPQSFYDYDPTTQEIRIGGLDDSYFKEHKPTDIPGGVFGMDPSGRIVLPTNSPGDMSTTKPYKPLNLEQKIDAFEIISTLTGKSISEIPEEFLDTKKGRELLKDYYSKYDGKRQIQATIDNTDQLREYGGDPEKATKDLYANYQSRLIFDVKEGRQLTPQEFERYLSDGKLEVRGAYNSENVFGYIGANTNPNDMASPLAVNLKDDDGRVIKTFAISRSPQFKETQQGFESIQYNKLFNSTNRLPDVFRNENLSLITSDGVVDLPIKIKYNSDQKNYTVTSDIYPTFTVTKITDLGNKIKQLSVEMMNNQ